MKCFHDRNQALSQTIAIITKTFSIRQSFEEMFSSGPDGRVPGFRETNFSADADAKETRTLTFSGAFV